MVLVPPKNDLENWEWRLTLKKDLREANEFIEMAPELTTFESV